MNDAIQILDAALALTAEQRAGLAYKLLQTLKPDGVRYEDDPDLPNELERRVLAFERGETTASEWGDVSARISQALADRKPS